MGPFLAPSVFPEEDPGVAEKYFSDKIIPSELKTAAKDLQQDLGRFLLLFFGSDLILLSYPGTSTRYGTGNLIKKSLEINNKKIHKQG